MKWTKKLLLLLLLPWLSFTGQAHSAELKAYVDQNIVQMGQYIQFSLTLSGKSSSKDPDFSVLQQDFDVLSGMSKSSQTQIINGSMSSSNTWSVTITPKNDGALVIPPIELAGLKSQPITVVVGKAPAKEYSDVYFETKISSHVVYVQAQLRLDLKLYIKMADIANTQLDELTIPNAKIFPIGENRQSEVVQNGIRYFLVEKSYFIYPEQSGELKIPALRFQAVVNEGSRYSRFGTRRSISASSDAKTIKVLGIPSTYPKNVPWLPAENIVLAESFNPELTAGIGEPITRTIITKASGLPAAALPPVELSDIKGLKIYPDQGKTDDKLTLATLTGTRTDSFALIANQAGQIQFADYKLAWWDTKNNQLRYAELTGKQLEIIANGSDTTTGQVTLQQASAEETEQEIDAALNENANQFINLTNFKNNDSINKQEFILVLIAFLIIWLLTIGGFIFYIYHLKKNGLKLIPKKNNESENIKSENLKSAVQALKHACKNNDTRQVRNALIHWGNIQFPEHSIKGLDQLASLLNNTALKESFKNIDRNLYETSNESINLVSFFDEFSKVAEAIKLRDDKKEKGKALSQLYQV